jgi:hypothetical protein
LAGHRFAEIGSKVDHRAGEFLGARDVTQSGLLGKRSVEELVSQPTIDAVERLNRRV